jgi:rhamnose transport system substrate-binding protein
MSKTIALTLALAVLVAAGVLAPGSSGAAHRRYTIAFAIDSKDPRWSGIRRADTQLGVRSVLLTDKHVPDLVARHVNAVVGDGYDPTLRPFFRRVRRVGILALSSGDDIAGPRNLWVNYSGATDFGHALADALASQIQDKGEYAILDEQGQYPIANTWEKVVAAYIPQTYPNMKLDGVLNLTGAGDQAEVDAVKSFMSAHPNLKGLIGIVPTEAYMAAAAITQTNKIGQVFSAGNGGTALKGTDMVGYVKSGATEDVIAGDPVNLGCLTVWAAHYLLAGHHFEPGTYRLRGGLGSTCGLQVSYYRRHQELRLGQPLTITKANVDQYAG